MKYLQVNKADTNLKGANASLYLPNLLFLHNVTSAPGTTQIIEMHGLITCLITHSYSVQMLPLCCIIRHHHHHYHLEAVD